MKKISWIVALLVALSFTILFSSCGEDPIPPKGVTIKLAGDGQEVFPVAVKTSAVSLEDGSGYSFASNNWDDGYVYFQIDGKKLKESSLVKFTITGSGSDPNYKKIAVYAEDDPGDFEPKDADCLGGASGGSDWGAPASGYGTGTQTKEFTVTIKGEVATKKAYVCIFVRGNGGVYTITDIEITP